MVNQSTANQNNTHDLFEAFPAPRGWQFGGDLWAGNAHEKDTTDFLPAAPQIQISIIRTASVR
ncbi:MAG: hypothetical protein JXN59_06840 [Anaerolineae bacterium]|nr:hypothetical protein [Anaerolineae bacterium]